MSETWQQLAYGTGGDDGFDGGGAGASSSSSSSSSSDLVSATPVGAQQHEVIELLRQRHLDPDGLGKSAFLSAEDIKAEANVDIEASVPLQQSLRSNPKVTYRPRDGSYRYKVKYDRVVSPETLLEALEEKWSGLIEQELLDTYDGVAGDIAEMVRDGRLIKVKSKDTPRQSMLYARGPRFLVNLTGTVSVSEGDDYLTTSVDLRKEVRRGDTIQVIIKARKSAGGGRAGKAGAGRAGGKKAPSSSSSSSSAAAAAASAAAAAAPSGEDDEEEVLTYRVCTEAPGKTSRVPTSVSSVKPHSEKLKEGDYRRPFTREQLPLDRPWEGPDLAAAAVRKFGCTNDLRQAWSKTADKDSKSFPRTHEALGRLLVQHGIRRPGQGGGGAGRRGPGGQKRPGQGKGAKKKKKKRAQSRPMRLTNTHLKGTHYHDTMKALQSGAITGDGGSVMGGASADIDGSAGRR